MSKTIDQLTEGIDSLDEAAMFALAGFFEHGGRAEKNLPAVTDICKNLRAIKGDQYLLHVAFYSKMLFVLSAHRQECDENGCLVVTALAHAATVYCAVAGLGNDDEAEVVRSIITIGQTFMARPEEPA